MPYRHRKRDISRAEEQRQRKRLRLALEKRRFLLYCRQSITPIEKDEQERWFTTINGIYLSKFMRSKDATPADD